MDAQVPAPIGPGTLLTQVRDFFVARGYAAGVAPGAEPLGAACDVLLVHPQNPTLSLVALLDCSGDSTRRFALTAQDLVRIGIECQRHTGVAGVGKAPISIRVVELGRTELTNENAARLASLAATVPGGGLGGGIAVSAWHVDGAGTVESTSRLDGDRGPLEKLLGGKPVKRSRLVGNRVRQGVPWLTLAILGVLGLIFGGQMLYDPSHGSLSPPALVAFGGLARPLVFGPGGHEWWRVFTCALLHGSVLHIVFNGVALFLAGAFLERLVGRAWLLALFVLGALGGSFVSMAVNPPEIVSVGASGAIMGLLAAGLTSSFRLPRGPARTQVQFTLARILVPSLLPLATAGGEHVDIGAHLGGTIVGAVMGFVLYKTWPASDPRPRFASVARAIAGAGLCAFAAGLVLVHTHFARYALDANLIPDDQLPADGASMISQAADLEAKYPADPRPHYARALAYAQGMDWPHAESELDEALSHPELFQTEFKPVFEMEIRVTLGRVLMAEGRADDACAAVAPACAYQGDDAADLQSDLADLNLCR
jgi:rhomboid protease GluP